MSQFTSTGCPIYAVIRSLADLTKQDAASRESLSAPWGNERKRVMSGLLSQLDAAHWQKRAEEARLLAEQMTDPEARRQMLEIAASYDKIARRFSALLRPTDTLASSDH